MGFRSNDPYLRMRPGLRWPHPGRTALPPSSEFLGGVDLTVVLSPRLVKLLAEAEVELEVVEPRDVRVDVFAS